MTIFLTGLLTSLALIVAIGAQSLFIMRQALRREHLVLALAACLAGDVVLIFGGTAGIGVVAERVPWLIQALTWGGVLYLLWFAARSFRSAFARRSMEPRAPDAGPGAAGAPAGGLDAEPDWTGAEGRDLVAERQGGNGLDGEGAAGTTSALAVRVRGSEQRERPSGAGHRAPADRVSTPARTVVLMALSVSVLNPHAILDTVIMLGTLANSYGAHKWVFAAGAVTGSATWFLTLGLGVRALAPLLDTPRTWRIVDCVVGVVMLAIAAKLALG